MYDIQKRNEKYPAMDDHMCYKNNLLSIHNQPVYIIKAKVAFLESRLLSSQSELFQKY